MCTGITITSKEGNSYWGRTQEFNVELAYDGAIIPRNYDLAVSLDRFKTRYAVMGVAVGGNPLLVDGVNEKGLMGGSFYFGNYNRYIEAEQIRAMDKLPLAGAEFVTYALTNYATVEELKERVNQDTAIAIVDNFFGIPQHYVFQDESGCSVVVEPSVDGEYEIYDNPVGVFTNSPKFDWHLTNLQNYVGLSDQIAPDIQLEDLHVFSNGKGSGLRGIPGDFTPQSRFVRATYLKHFSESVSDDLAVEQIFHILNSFDIPKGVVKVSNDKDIQYTQYTSAYDSKEKVMYIHLYENRMIQRLALSEGVLDSSAPQYFDLKKEQHYYSITKKD
ncbi:linear amide C-N hydrolase [Candidatus Enterococcus ikei]|uniref:Choloylglycine hydrolase family protein n=1 Tax=Candidatus Enterococcus ikei TaxID=2815326 RepID=A0ABS3GXQ3_9ENTE|nr:choloylglycine hydrolase family protein [Enterococcus sp. DIV0869a]MBO0439224.1 choloylglycine hydrolase family protein [Enterococcus sp. DIV0869a]